MIPRTVPHLVTILLVVPFLAGSPFSPAPASGTGIRDTHRDHYRRVNDSPTFVLRRSFDVRGDSRVLIFLFDHLDVSGDLLRVWGLGRFDVTEESPRYYRATKGDDLAGTCYLLHRKPNRAVFVGEGVYRPDHSPIDVPGTAVVTILWESPETDRIDLDVTLKLRPNSWLVRWLGTLLHPLVHPPLKKSFDRLVQRGPRLMEHLRERPRETLRKLEADHPESASRWKAFLGQQTAGNSPPKTPPGD